MKFSKPEVEEKYDLIGDDRNLTGFQHSGKLSNISLAVATKMIGANYPYIKEKVAAKPAKPPQDPK